jgi:hypothetical protein
MGIDPKRGNNADLYSDAELRAMAREMFVREMAREFRVPMMAMHLRLQGTGPFLPPADKEATP